MYKRKFFAKKKNITPPPKSTEFVVTEEYKNIIRSQSYLGKKGYTIPKSIISKQDEEFLRKDLFVKPVLMGNAFGAGESTLFPVFRENANKMYLPRFYGIQRYGIPSKSEISDGDNIDVSFPKPLRDYQDKIVDVYMKYVNSTICSESEQKGNGGILEVPCGRGKTVLALKIISILKKKTLIIVHKEFLMNQWIDRINEFLPGAKVGKIQGSVFDVEGNDIVIGMIQTLYDKEYPIETFSCFGLTIIDEVHRIGSEQFSRTLFKTITPYMLGISATVDRKDKLTKVLYMFIGEKIYTEKREDDDLVSVRAIRYQTNDPEFNEVEVDFRGTAKYSTMITKLCDFGPRSDFIIRVIKDLVEEEPDNQIMILCHNRSLLSYLYDGITYRNIAPVGYYVGGMKQKNLQETETKQIVLATYAMAAEALDIKSLSTLVMVTPKTDITQSVGRILRVKHENPIIVDIVDSHDLFQNQWAQRRRFYKKCNYRIREIDSKTYTGMAIDWGNDATWKRTFDPKTKTDDIGTCKIAKDDSDDELDTKHGIGSGQGKCLINFSGLSGLDD
uniref:Helicase ATP-binding domain-containing protein n=1 Tax=viral metagenome TaxID=1070528 RepID=A0A6C0LAC3_9ZZZZ